MHPALGNNQILQRSPKACLDRIFKDTQKLSISSQNVAILNKHHGLARGVEYFLQKGAPLLDAIPDNSFRESGTNVSTVLVVLDKR